jgi:hypothetical protein
MMLVPIKKLVMFSLLILCCFSLKAQENKKFNYSLETGIQLSNSGIGTYLNGAIERNKHQFYLGPMLSLSDSYFPKNNVTGFNTGYRYQILKMNKLSSFIGLHYSLLSYKVDYKDKTDYIQEIYINQSVQYQLGKHFSLRNTVGIGQYSEYVFFVNEGDRDAFKDFGSLIRLSCVYSF